MASRKGLKKGYSPQALKSIGDRFRETVEKIELKGEKVITMIMIAIQNRAAFYTPQDTNALINSQYRQVVGKEGTKLMGRVGYTQDYAAALHGDDNYVPSWKPMKPEDRRPQGGAYNPNAKPYFLRDGVNESIDEASSILRSEYGNL